jgi:hypothetical protein
MYVFSIYHGNIGNVKASKRKSLLPDWSEQATGSLVVYNPVLMEGHGLFPAVGLQHNTV